MTMRLNSQTLLIVTLTCSLMGANALLGETAPPISSSGTDFMAPKRDVHGKSIGQEDVLIEEVALTDSGRRYRRLDVGDIRVLLPLTARVLNPWMGRGLLWI